MYRIIILCLSFLVALNTFSQNFIVKGGVADSSDGSAIAGVIVGLYQENKQVTVSVSSAMGAFELEGISPGDYILRTQMLGYKNLEFPLKVKEDVMLGSFFLIPTTTELSGIDVKGSIGIGQNKGDTSEYNAAAFKTQQNASTQDLLEKMPGVRNDNGTVKAEGEAVQQVLVDGKPFFGRDVNTALGVLPAEVVDKIQIFDDQSEQSKASGVDDGSRVKTVNIVTKINMRYGEFGQIYAGGGMGSDDELRYSMGSNINAFRGNQRFSFLGQFNNINQQNFSTADLLGVVADNSGRGHRRGPAFMRGFQVGSDASDFMVNPQNGIIQTLAGGLNYQDSWSDKLDISASYFYNRSNTEAIGNTFQQYFLSEINGQNYEETDESNAINDNHRFNAKLTYNPTEQSSFFLLPSISTQSNRGDQSIGSVTSQEGVVLTALNSLFNSDYSAVNWSNDLMFRHRFEKPGRSVFARLMLGNDSKVGESDLFTREFGIEEPNIDQRADFSSKDMKYTAGLMYAEPIGENGLGMMFTYDIENTQSEADQNTYNLLFEPQILDSLLSNRYNNDWLSQTMGIGIRKFNRQFGFVLRLKYEITSLANDQLLPFNTQLERNYKNWLPFALIRKRAESGASFFAMYRTYTNAPSASQLQSFIDNTNPLQLSTGNDLLEQQYSHYLRLRYKYSNKMKTKVVFAGTRIRYSNSYIGNQTVVASTDEFVNGYFLSAGSQITAPINLPDYFNINTMINYGFPIKALKSNFNIDLSNTIVNTPSMINMELNSTLSSLYEIGLVLSSNISENVDFTISSVSGYSLVDNKLNSDLNTNYFIQRSKIKYSWVLPMGFTFRTVLEHQQYLGLSETLDNTVLLWTVGIGKQLFKDKRGEIQLSVFDILGQNNQSVKTSILPIIRKVRAMC